MNRVLVFFLLLSTIAFSQVKDTIDLSNPRTTIYTHINFLQEDNYNLQLSSKTIYGKSGEEAEEIALKIKRILDGKGLKIDFNKIPETKDFRDSTRTFPNNVYVLFPYQLPEVYLQKVGDNWYYSKETVGNIDKIYKNVYPWQSDKLQQIIPDIGHKKYFGLELWQFLGFVVIIVLSIVLYYILHRIVYYVLRRVQYWVVHKKNQFINVALKKLARPIVLLLLCWFVELLLPSLFLPLELNKILLTGLEIMVTVFWIYVFLKLVKVFISIYSEYAEATESKLDDQLIPVLNNFLSGVVVFAGLLKLLMLFGVDPVTVIAGASIGGLALALASQDTVKNLIGTLMIFLDKPFHIGDWIEAGTVAGTVEKVGFRSTRVRATDTSIFQIPNSSLAEMVVNNKGLRSFRRYQTNLGIRYDTPPELIEAFVVGIRKIIAIHDGTRNDLFTVEFVGFGDSALLILVDVYFTDLQWTSEQRAKHTLHMEILKFAKDLGVEFAFPSSTIMVEDFPEKKSGAKKYDNSQERIKLSIDRIK